MDIEMIKADLNEHNYKLIEPIGSGGFGTVYKVQEHISTQYFAVKLLHNKHYKDLSHFIKEIRFVSTLDHPNIINYKHSFKADDKFYMVMEYCEQGNLNGYVKQNDFSYEYIAKIFISLTQALSFINAKNVFHHDIKPENILIDANGVAKVSDFGAANTTIHTPFYMPPEFLEGKSKIDDPRVDVFSLGLTLLEVIIKEKPLAQLTREQRLIKIKNRDLPVAGIPFWMQYIILKACHPDNQYRFQSMDEFKQALIEKDIPKIISPGNLEKEQLTRRLYNLVNRKKWSKAKDFIETNYTKLIGTYFFHIQSGKLFLNTNELFAAKEEFEKAQKINPYVTLEKEMAEVHLQLNEPAKAAAILQNYINRNFYDAEAQNQLLYTYWLGGKYELGLQQAMLIRQAFPNENVFRNNQLIFELVFKRNQSIGIKFEEENSFIEYNYWDVVKENNLAFWYYARKPFISSKLLFQEYKFRNIHKAKNTIVVYVDGIEHEISDSIVSFGREEYPNTFNSFEGNNVSRRHFVIINQKDNVWLYDLDSTGVWVDSQLVEGKYFLHGLHQVYFGDYTIRIKSNNQLLI